MDDFKSNRKIARNTLILYLRMCFTVCVGLYTSRVILRMLGVIDYGIYNVVGGVVTMFTFISTPMIAATQRFITYELGKQNETEINKVVNTSLFINIILSIVILIAAETIGLWFVCHKLVIPTERLTTAIWTYEMSIIVCIISLISQPYNALIIAHEQMNVYAFASIFESILKLFIVFSLSFIDADKLKIYSSLLLLPAIATFLCYYIYSKINYSKEIILKVNMCFNSKTRDIAEFAGWNLYGGIAYVVESQGVNILLNLFFGPAINAARAISMQINGIASNFYNNFQNAINPQITKNFASNNLNRTKKLAFIGSKISFFMVLCIALPVILESNFLLQLWLGKVPSYTQLFVNLTLFSLLINTLSTPFTIITLASGNIRTFQIIIGSIEMSAVFFDYVLLKMGYKPYIVYFVSILIGILSLYFRFLLVKKILSISLDYYFKTVLLRVLSVCLIAFSCSLFIKSIFIDGVIYSIIKMFIDIIIVLLCTYMFGCDSDEKTKIIVFIKNRILNLCMK